jgi:hypothetical protein
MTPDYGRLLDPALGASIRVEFTTERRTVSNYSVVLLVTEADGLHTVRVYDGAHGVNEMHRYTRSAGKQAGEVFDDGTLGDGMRAAIRQIETSYTAMIDAWRRS